MKNTQNQAQPERNDMALASLVIGGISLLTGVIPPFLYAWLVCAPFGILAAVLGFMALRQVASGHGRPADRWMALAGIILGLLPVTVLLGIFLYTLLTGQMDSSGLL